MPIRVSCPSCAAGLKIADQHVGRTIACPKCKHHLKVPAAEDVEELVLSKEETAEHRPEPTPRPKKVVAIQAERPVVKRVKAAAPSLPDDDEAASEAVEDEERPIKRRRKKRRRKREDEPNAPIWPWYVAAGVSLFIILCAGLWLAFHTGAIATIGVIALTLVVMFPISAVFFIVSVLVTSAVGGGLDLGPLKTAIPKAVLLLCIVDLVMLLPGGLYLAMIPWIIGLMGLFGLDIWEAKIIIAVNWVLNYLFNLIVMTAIISAMMHKDAGGGIERSPQGGQPVAPGAMDRDDD